MKLPSIIGHRGLCSQAPENTIAAMKAATENGIDWVEVDLSVLGDGTLVIFHDDDLQRCTQKSGLLTDITFKDLSEIDAGSWFSKAFSNEPIPTLSDLLRFLSSHNMGLNLELKSQPGADHEKMINQTLSEIQDYWQSDKPLLVSSFDHDLLALYRQKQPNANLALLYESVDDDWLTTAQKLNPVSLHCNYQLLNQQIAQRIKSHGFQLAVYTCNDTQQVEKLIHWGVDSIISDVAHQLLPLLNHVRKTDPN